MSLQPSDPAAEAFERLRLEVALLRRAVEGLAADAVGELPDYSPTLAELSGAVADVGAQVAALGERPALALSPEQLGALLQQGTGRLLAKPLAELERDRNALAQATEALRAARQADGTRSRSWRRLSGLVSAAAVCGVILWSLLLGPVVRMLPSGWAVPERLAAATLALPIGTAGDRLLRRGDPAGWEALQAVRELPSEAMADLRHCAAASAEAKPPRTCTLKLSRSEGRPSEARALGCVCRGEVAGVVFSKVRKCAVRDAYA